MKKVSIILLAFVLLSMASGLDVSAEQMEHQYSIISFVEKEVIPMLLKNDQPIETLSNDEIKNICSLGTAYGKELAYPLERYISPPRDVSTEDFMKDLVSIEFGECISWSIEQQHWFGEVMTTIGCWDQNPYTLPTEGEVLYTEALQIAKNTLKTQYEANLDDISLWEEYVSMLSDPDMDDNGSTWWFYFSSLTVEQNSYEVYLSASGTVLSTNVIEHNLQASNNVIDTFSEVYGSVDLWAPETWASFGNALSKCSDASAPTNLQYYLRAHYLEPSDNYISVESAQKIALDTIDLEYTDIFVSICCMDDDMPIWKIVAHTLEPEDIDIGKYTHTWMVEIDCMTGKVRDFREWDFFRDEAIMLYVPISLFEQE